MKRLLWAVLCCLMMARAAVWAEPTATPTPAKPEEKSKEQPKKAPFEKEIEAFEAADKKSPPPLGAVLFVGSSSIRLWKTLAQDFPEITVINRGFGGSQIADSVRYAERIVIPYKPKMIVFYAGGNDINAKKSPEQVLKDFQAFVEKVHAALPDTRIVYISINPSVARWKQEEKILEANRLIEAFVREIEAKKDEAAPKLSIIETHSKLLSPEGKPRPEILRADGLHLNAKGYELWTALVKPQILALLAADKEPEN